MNNYANYLYIAIRAALDAGKAIMDIYTDPESDFGIERKADNSPLTKADKKAHAIISMALSVTPFPVLSEEGKEIPFAERSGWDMLWIVDPLDGTKEFIKKNGEFTVNIALVKEGVPVLGVIYAPAMYFQRCFIMAGLGSLTNLFTNVKIEDKNRITMKSVAWYKHLMKKYHSYGSLSPGLGDKSRAVRVISGC